VAPPKRAAAPSPPSAPLFDNAHRAAPRPPPRPAGPLPPARTRVGASYPTHDERGLEVSRREWMFVGSCEAGMMRPAFVGSVVRTANRWLPDAIASIEAALERAGSGSVVVGLTRAAVEVTPGRWVFVYPGGKCHVVDASRAASPRR